MSNTTQHSAPATADTEAPAVAALKVFVNYPTLVKGAGSTTDARVTADYSDGYGGEYSKGE